MIIISFKDLSTSNGAPKIVFSKISPPIYIDSRIAAREKKQAKAPAPVNVPETDENGQQELASDLFDPSLLVKELVKKVKGKGKKEEETSIQNNLKGLYDYLTSPNIRKKTKNILFYILRFSNCVKPYLPTELAAGANVEDSYFRKWTF